MKNVRLFLSIVAITFSWDLGCKAQYFTPVNPESEVVKFAADWLLLLDSEDYESARLKTVKTFYDDLPYKEWVTVLNEVRNFSNQKFSRTVNEAGSTKTIEDNLGKKLRGEFVTVKFALKFEAAESMFEVEAVVLQKIKGHWRVTGHSFY